MRHQTFISSKIDLIYTYISDNKLRNASHCYFKFQGLFWHPKNNKNTGSSACSFTPDTSVQLVLQLSVLKSAPSILLTSFFQRI